VPHKRLESVSLAEVEEAIRREVGNYPCPGETVIVINPDEPYRRLYKLRHASIDPTSFTLTDADGQQVGGYSLYPDRGWVRLTATFPAGTELVASYVYTPFSQGQVVSAIDQAIQQVAPYYYIIAVSVAVTVSGAGLYALPDDCWYAERVEVKEAGDDRYRVFRDWTVEEDGANRYLRILTDIYGDAIVRYVKKPKSVTDISGNLSDYNISDDAKQSIVLYASWSLLHQAITRRLSQPEFLNADEPNLPTTREMQQQAAFLYQAYEESLKSGRKTPTIRRF
jgi:hypothetical protein